MMKSKRFVHPYYFIRRGFVKPEGDLINNAEVVMYKKISVGALLIFVFFLFVLVLAQTGATPAQAFQTASTQASLLLFEAYLTGEEEAPTPVASPASGRASFVLDEDTNTLYYLVVVYDIAGITAAHIHVGASGVAGTIVFNLFPNGGDVFDPENAIHGSLDLSAGQIATLLSGDYYVNVHTPEHPAGEIRGQIESFTPGDFNTVLTGKEETPPVVTNASGWAHLRLHEAADAVDYAIHVSDITNITAAHLHPGFPGDIGPAEIDLYGPGDEDEFAPGSPISGTAPLTEPEHVLNLISGRYYLNVHTQEHTAGEIRGQVRWGYHPFTANLKGEEEVPPVETEATGKSVMVLDADMQTLYYRSWVRDITGITQAHIHLAPRGVNGQIVHWLFPNGGTIFDPLYPISGVLNLTPEEVTELVAGNYYVNVHTESHPAGEIRGQLMYSELPDRAFALLAPTNQALEIGGNARFRVNPETGYTRLHYSVDLMGEITPTIAQIHVGQEGEIGPGVILLYDQDAPRTFGQDSPIEGERALTAENLRDLLSSNLYLMIQADEPGRDLRGQINPEHRLLLPLIIRE
jgi:hypothetical protein